MDPRRCRFGDESAPRIGEADVPGLWDVDATADRSRAASAAWRTARVVVIMERTTVWVVGSWAVAEATPSRMARSVEARGPRDAASLREDVWWSDLVGAVVVRVVSMSVRRVVEAAASQSRARVSLMSSCSSTSAEDAISLKETTRRKSDA